MSDRSGAVYGLRVVGHGVEVQSAEHRWRDVVEFADDLFAVFGAL